MSSDFVGKECFLEDPTAAHDLVTVIENRRLAGRHGALRVVKSGKYLVSPSRFERCPGRFVPVANLDLDAHRRGQFRNGDPV